MAAKLFKNTKGFIKNYIFNKNPLAKFACLVISIMLFIYVNFEEQNSLKYSIPIDVKNIPPSLGLYDLTPKNVTISFKGDAQIISMISENLSASVNATNAQMGTNEYVVVLDNIYNFPENIEFTLHPELITITFTNNNQSTN